MDWSKILKGIIVAIVVLIAFQGPTDAAATVSGVVNDIQAFFASLSV